MSDHSAQLRHKLSILSRQWITHGLDSRQDLENKADMLEEWKTANNSSGLWTRAPALLTVTLDDGLGQGLGIIERYASLAGMQVTRLGLLVTPQEIVTHCHRQRPDLLGLTVLQLDSEDDLAYIGEHLPDGTNMIAGGPVFGYDPELAERCGIAYAAKNVAYFINYVLNDVDFANDFAP
ncbi:MAG: cobalamin B12-binding domain-containing protein [Desulfobacteraceae bacterium]|nr:cobalamin B12-binding domain-containing protein [Desulfobacteraceae bacterium]